MLLDLVTGPTAEPITPEEAKAHCKVDHDVEDDQFERWIEAARDYVETFTRRQLMPATWSAILPCFWTGAYFQVPRAPLVSVSSITYYDTSNASQTWATAKYNVVAPSGPKCRPGMLTLAYGQVFPSTYDRPDAVTITWSAGYADAASVPGSIKQAMLMLVAEMNLRRSEVTIGASLAPNVLAAERLLRPFVVHGERWRQ